MLAATTTTIPITIGIITALTIATIIVRQRIESSKTRRYGHPTPLLHEARTRKLIADLRRENRALIRENSRLHGVINQIRKEAPHLDIKHYGRPDA